MKRNVLCKILLVCCAAALFAGCAAAGGAETRKDAATPGAATERPETPRPATAVPESTPAEACAFGAWVPYWDYENALADLDTLEDRLAYAVCFAAIFDAQDQLLLLPDAQKTLALMLARRAGAAAIYLSVVNDIEVEAYVYDNKSPALLWRLLGTDEALSGHIEDLMELLRSSGADGLEIDYEAIRSDTALWQRFALFIERLYARTEAEGYPLRVVLSWDAAKQASFPEGPQYSVMCYNLYGTHSGPGPKADRDFLRQVFDANRALPGEPVLAFATGGFDWSADGSATALSLAGAEALRSERGVTESGVQRDGESAALTFTYFDAAGLTHTVWYADETTLLFWRSLALEAGYTGFDLFLLDGNAAALSAFFTPPNALDPD